MSKPKIATEDNQKSLREFMRTGGKEVFKAAMNGEDTFLVTQHHPKHKFQIVAVEK
jgi:hypothetical protein